MVLFFYNSQLHKNKSLSRDCQIMSAETNLNETDVKKRKLEEVHQNSISCGNQTFSKFCKENGAEYFQDENVNSFTKLGK